jgi:hypothetical protein
MDSVGNKTYESLKSFWHRLELKHSSPQYEIEKYGEEVAQILRFPDGYVLPVVFLHQKRDDENFLIEWPRYGIFCKFQSSSAEISFVNREQQMQKEFSADEFVTLLPTIVPLSNSTKIYKIRSRTNKFVILDLVTVTCLWTNSNDEGCEDSTIVSDPRVILPEGFILYSVPLSLFDKVDKAELESILLPDIISIEETDNSISKLKIESGRICKLLEGGETYNYFNF